MHTFILTLHILAALVMSSTIAVVFAAAVKQYETRAYRWMLGAFGTTLASGIGLLLVSPAGLGRFCVMMSAFTLSVIAVRAYYRARVAQVA